MLAETTDGDLNAVRALRAYARPWTGMAKEGAEGGRGGARNQHRAPSDRGLQNTKGSGYGGDGTRDQQRMPLDGGR